MIAFKTFNDCPEDQRIEGVSLNFPWVEHKITNETESITFQSNGYIVMTEDDFDKYKKSISPQLVVEAAILASIEFGAKILKEFSAENVLLGITYENKTGEVLDKLGHVMSAILAGSLYEAIVRIKAIPVTDYDVKYITAVRLLGFVNKIESYLGTTLSETL